MKSIIFITLTFVSYIVYSQDNLLTKNYLTYSEIIQQKEKMGNQFTSWSLSKIGKYDEAKKVFEENRDIVFNLRDSVFPNISYHSAIEFIDSISQHERAVFINEAHHVSLHRNFVRRILPILYKNGYRYFGMEAFNSGDTLITKRGYPIKESGFFTKDPEYAELLRDAIKLGFNIFGYEAGIGKNGKEREIEQAQNIWNYIKKDSLSKVLIYAGFDHIREDTCFRTWEKAMAGRFYEFSSINPLTIDQVQFTPRFYDYNNNPLIYNIKDTILPLIPTFGDSLFKNPYSKKGFDYYIFHPQYDKFNLVPVWKTTFNRKQYLLDKYKFDVNESYLILAYDLDEYQSEKNSTERLVPKDIVSVDNGIIKPLLLSSNTYYLEVLNSKGEVIYSKNIVVE